MKMTKNKIEAILRRHDELMEWVDSFISENNGSKYRDDSRISYNIIEEYVNTACGCHPEYEWIKVGTMDDFISWLEKKQQ